MLDDSKDIGRQHRARNALKLCHHSAGDLIWINFGAVVLTAGIQICVAPAGGIRHMVGLGHFPETGSSGHFPARSAGDSPGLHRKNFPCDGCDKASGHFPASPVGHFPDAADI